MRKRKYFGALLLCFAMVVSCMFPTGIFAASEYFQGEGTAKSPYLIETAQDMVEMANAINSDAAYASAHYKLTNDIDFTGVSMISIGKKNHFKGVFDGQLNVIKNLTLKDTSENTGLFSFVEGGTVKNVGIVNSTITGAKKTGALVGRSMDAVFMNCYSTATVSGTGDVGGIVGMLNSSQMYNCYSLANVTSTNEAGGLTGSLNTSLNKANPVILDNVYSAATVSGGKYYAIIAAWNENMDAETPVYTTNAYYYGEKGAFGNYGYRPNYAESSEKGVTALAKESLTDGTLLDALNANLEDGYVKWAAGDDSYPTFSKEYERYEAALIGAGTEESPYLIASVDDLMEMASAVNNSFDYAGAYYKMTASIDLKDSEFNGIGSVNAFAGTFDGAGHVFKNVSIDNGGNSYTGIFQKADGAVIKNVGIESGMIEGGSYVGGIAGQAKNTTILNCFNAAEINGYNDIGGLIGISADSMILNSFNKGLIRVSNKSIGGLCGSSERTTVKNSYNIGRVSIGTYTGRLAGYSYDDKFANAYYDKEAAIKNQPIGNMTEYEGLVGLTKAELMAPAFVDTLNENLEDGYMQWVYGEDKIARLSGFEEVAKLDIFKASIDTLEIVDGKVQMAVSADGKYQTALYGSDHKSVIDLDGNVYQPLTEKKVLLILDVVDTQTGEVVDQIERNVEVIVAGKYADAGVNEVPNVVPGLREWYGLTGNFTVTEDTRIVAANAEFADMAARVQEYMKDMLGLDLEAVEGEAKAGDIVLKYVPEKYTELQEEGYTIAIDDQIVIEAATETAAFYGSISIMQILYQDDTHTNIPKGYVRDYPQYEMRGGMMDVARKFFSIDYVEEIGKYMSWFKMNTLSLHINDNGGEYTASFVVESKKYPQLNSYNGKYIWTQDEYRQMQKDLKEFGVNVITEIDTPGHAKAFANVNGTIVNGASFNLGSYYDESLALVQDVFDEFLDGEDPVFQNAIVHIGTDESSNSKENMRRYINDLSQYILAKDNVDKVVFWGNLSLYYGQNEVNPEDVITQIWDSADFRADEALELGFEVINSTSNMMYLVPNQSGIFGPGSYFQGYIDMARFYDTWKGASDFDTHNLPNPSNKGNGFYYAEHDILKGNPKVLGTLFCDWNDSGIGYDYDLLELMMAYIAGVSEKCWYGDVDRFESGADFVEAFNKVGNYAAYANPRYRVDTDTNTIAMYDFEEMTDGVVKDTANGYDAVVTNGSIKEVDAAHKSALAFDGTTSVALPFDGIGYPYTAKFDIYLDGEQSQDTILFSCDDCTIYLDYDGHGVSFQSGKFVYSFNVAIPTDEWVEIRITSRSPGLVHASTNVTVLAINGEEYTPSNILSSRSQSRSTVLGTKEMFTGLVGYLDNLSISNKYSYDPALDLYVWNGDGTQENPFLIQSAEDLKMFSAFINAGIHMDACFKFAADIDMTDVKYEPAAEFRGTLDGDGHKISNLTISKAGLQNCGLIGMLDGGTVKNLGIVDSTITGGKYTGALVGRTMNAVVMNCYSSATVNGTGDVGGICGMFNSSQMYNCYSTAVVTGTTETIGGICGSFNSSLNLDNLVSVDNIYSAATVNGPKYAGAIVGWDEGSSTKTPVHVTNAYFYSSLNASGNYAERKATRLTEAELTDGTLLSALNANLKYGYKAWAEGEDGYPVLSDEDYTLQIIKQPENVSAKNGADAVVTVKAQGEGLTYTWYYKNPGNVKFYVSGDQFVSEDGTSYIIPMAAWRDGQEVYCVVTDKYGDTVQSNTVALTMDNGSIQIVKQPEDAAVDVVGGEAVVTVEATGTDLTYQWYYKNPGNVKFYVSGDQFVSEDGASYTIPVAAWRDGQQVYCVITDANGISVQTNTVTLSVAK